MAARDNVVNLAAANILSWDELDTHYANILHGLAWDEFTTRSGAHTRLVASFLFEHPFHESYLPPVGGEGARHPRTPAVLDALRAQQVDVFSAGGCDAGVLKALPDDYPMHCALAALAVPYAAGDGNTSGGDGHGDEGAKIGRGPGGNAPTTPSVRLNRAYVPKHQNPRHLCETLLPTIPLIQAIFDCVKRVRLEPGDVVIPIQIFFCRYDDAHSCPSHIHDCRQATLSLGTTRTLTYWEMDTGKRVDVPMRAGDMVLLEGEKHGVFPAAVGGSAGGEGGAALPRISANLFFTTRNDIHRGGVAVNGNQASRDTPAAYPTWIREWRERVPFLTTQLARRPAAAKAGGGSGGGIKAKKKKSRLQS